MNGKVSLFGYDYTSGNNKQLNKVLPSISHKTFNNFLNIENNITYISINGHDDPQCGHLYTPCKTLRQALKNAKRSYKIVAKYRDRTVDFD